MKLRSIRVPGAQRMMRAIVLVSVRRSDLPSLLLGGALPIATALVFLPALSEAYSKNDVAQAEPAGERGAIEPARPTKARPPEPKPKPKPANPESGGAAKVKHEETKPPVPPPSAVPAGLAGAAAAGASAAPLNISAKLMQNGAGTCGSAIDAEAVPSMIGVTQSNTVSLWSNVEPREKHSASVFLAQRYGTSQAVPYGVTGLIASPTPSGSCDVTVVQVVASPLPCANVRETLVRQGGKLMGDVSGLPLVQTADNQTLLMPTGTNACVLIGFRAKFGD